MNHAPHPILFDSWDLDRATAIDREALAVLRQFQPDDFQPPDYRSLRDALTDFPDRDFAPEASGREQTARQSTVHSGRVAPRA